jgi:hypothetical protein
VEKCIQIGFTEFRKFTVHGNMEKWDRNVPAGLKRTGKWDICPAGHERGNVAGNNEMYFGLHVKYAILTELGVPTQIFIKVLTVKFHANPSSGNRTDTCG